MARLGAMGIVATFIVLFAIGLVFELLRDR